MTLQPVKLKIGIDNINQVKLGIPTSGRNTLTIGDGGDISSIEIATKATSIPNAWSNIWNDTDEVVLNTTNVKKFVIEGPENDILLLYYGILLKEELKAKNKGYEDNENKIILDYLKINDNSANAGLSKATGEWKLTEADFENYAANKAKILDISKRYISQAAGAPDAAKEVKLDDELAELYALNKEANDLANKYGEDNFKNGPDFDFPAVGDIDNDINKLKAYVCGGTSGVTKDNNNIKHVLYGVDNIEAMVNEFIVYLEQIKQWQSYGLTKKSQVAKALANDFTLADDAEIKKPEGTYKGFPIADPKQNAEEAATKTDAFVVTTSEYTKKNIDDFRTLFSKLEDNTPEKCFGFKPGDIEIDGTEPKYKKVGGSKRSEKLTEKIKNVKKDNGKGTEFEIEPTKNYFDISDAVDAETDKDKKLKAALENAFHKASFLETDSTAKLVDLLDLYAHQARGKIDYDTLSQGEKDKFDKEEYKETKEVLELINVDYKKSNTSMDDTKAEAAKVKLEGHKAKFKGLAIAGGWIERKIKEIADRSVQQLDQAIAAAITAVGTDANAKKVLEAFKNLGNGDARRTEVIFNALKELVDFLRATGVKKSDLDPFKNDATKTSPSEKGKAWKFVNETITDDGGWANKVYKTVEGGDEQEIKTAKIRLSNAIKSILTKDDNDVVLNEVIKDIKTNKDDINRAAEILEEAKKGDEATEGSTEANYAYNKLVGWQKNSTKVWAAVNKVKKPSNDSESYLEKILKKLAELDKKIAKLITDLNLEQAKTKVDVKNAEDAFKNLTVGSAEKTVFEQKIFPRKYLIAALEEKANPSNEEKELKTVIEHFWKKNSLDTDPDYNGTEKETQLTKLKENLTKLKKYQSDGSAKTVFESLDPSHKKTINDLIKEVELRVKAMETSQKEENISGEKPFYKTTLGIITIVLVITVVLGGIVYFMKSNSSEEEEEE